MRETELTTKLSAQQRQTIERKIWLLLKERIHLYTKGGSDSIPVELGEELLKSITFTIKVAEETPKINGASLPLEAVKELFEEGREILDYQCVAGKKLWQTACLTAPHCGQIAFEGTLKSIGTFFHHYDKNFFAHQIPCDIDYQLARPVSEELFGILYINQYLHQIIIENKLLAAFPKENICALLDQACIDYKESIANMCIPVLCNALSLICLNKDPLPLRCLEKDRLLLTKQFSYKYTGEISALLDIAVKELCRTVHIDDERSISYLSQTAKDIAPRLQGALESGDLSEIFLSF